jgi:hypothetical protein
MAGPLVVRANCITDVFFCPGLSAAGYREHLVEPARGQVALVDPEFVDGSSAQAICARKCRGIPVLVSGQSMSEFYTDRVAWNRAPAAAVDRHCRK